MRRFLVTLFCIAALSTAAFAQDDHNDLGAMQVGYAVVTPTDGISPFGIPSGLTVFETLGFRSDVPAFQAGALPASLTTRMILYPNRGIRSPDNVGISIANPAPTDANVTMTFRRPDGSTTFANTFTVPAHRQASKFIADLFAGALDADASLTITSNTPVAILAMRFHGTKFSMVPIASLSTSQVALPNGTPGVGGSMGVVMPQFAADGGWASRIVVMNNGIVPLTVRIDLFKQDGSPLVTTLNHQTGSSFQNLLIVPGSMIVFAPRNAIGVSDFYF